MNERAAKDLVSDEPGSARESGIVDVKDPDRALAEREASPVASAVESATVRDVDIDITTDDDGAPAEGGGGSIAPLSSGAAPTPLDAPALDTADATAMNDEEAIEVSDDEIETTEPPAPRPTLPSSAFGVLRSRPPAPPSSRPRSLSNSALPPPRHLSNRPSADPWALANKTLELNRALARVQELEEQVAYRDARVLELEDTVARLESRLRDLEQRSAPRATLPVAPPPTTPSMQPEAPVVTQTRPVVVPPPAGLDRGTEHPFGRARDEDVDEELDDEGEYDVGSGDEDASGAIASGSEDDLQQISGIGPRFEAALRKHGITRLSQIAAWSEADVRQVAKALKIPKSRIVKGRWVEVAREAVARDVVEREVIEREVIGTGAASE